MSAEPEEPRGGGAGDAMMRAAILFVLASGLGLAVAGLAFFGLRAGLGVAIGGALATANLWVFAQVGQAFVARKGNTVSWGVVAVLKLVVLLGGVWLILTSGVVSALSLAAGYAALPLGITIASLFGPKPPDEDGTQLGGPGRPGM
jgi:hypothetical protein